MQAFLNSAAVKAALNRTGSPLAALTVLKKVHLLGQIYLHAGCCGSTVGISLTWNRGTRCATTPRC